LPCAFDRRRGIEPPIEALGHTEKRKLSSCSVVSLLGEPLTITGIIKEPYHGRRHGILVRGIHEHTRHPIFNGFGNTTVVSRHRGPLAERSFQVHDSKSLKPFCTAARHDKERTQLVMCHDFRRWNQARKTDRSSDLKASRHLFESLSPRTLSTYDELDIGMGLENSCKRFEKDILSLVDIKTRDAQHHPFIPQSISVFQGITDFGR